MNRIPSIAFHASIDRDLSPFAPWTLIGDAFPSHGTNEEKWKYLLRFAVLAPSGHNTQPWLFRFHGRDVDLYADRARACHVVDPDDRELVMSCGCALYHLRSAMAHYRQLGHVDLFPDLNQPELLARVRLGVQGEETPEESAMFHAIPERRTNRQRFRDEPVCNFLRAAMQNDAKIECAWLHLVEGEEPRYAVAALIAEGDRRQWSNKSFRLELAAWIHSNRSGARDGIPGYAQGVNDLLSCAGPLVVRTFDMGEGQAAKDQDLARGSPLLAVLGTDRDTPRDWLNAGQALARVLLRARSNNVWASFLNQPIELPDLRQRLCVALGLSGFPQACLRLGYGEDVRPTPRRPVMEVLI